MSVAIYVGHGTSTDGSFDPGCTYETYTEAELVKAIAGACVSRLRENGVTVLTDYPENAINMIRQVDEANAAGAELYLSIHCDYSLAPSGAFMLRHPLSSGGEKLAFAIGKAISEEIGLGGRNGTYDHPASDRYELNQTKMVAGILECGSIKEDLSILKDADRYGRAIASGILNYLGKTDSQAKSAVSAASGSSAASGGSLWAVLYRQYFLRICNYGTPSLDGIEGAQTRNCYRIARRAYKLSDEALWDAALQTMASGQVLAVQKQLKQLGYPTDCDGIAGPDTDAKVRAFQKARGLTNDGIIGEKTYKALFG